LCVVYPQTSPLPRWNVRSTFVPALFVMNPYTCLPANWVPDTVTARSAFGLLVPKLTSSAVLVTRKLPTGVVVGAESSWGKSSTDTSTVRPLIGPAGSPSGKMFVSVPEASPLPSNGASSPSVLPAEPELEFG
jgi:hypothetical protein